MAVATVACNSHGNSRHRSQSRELAGRRHNCSGAHPVSRNMDEWRQRPDSFRRRRGHLRNIQVTRDEGTGSGSFTYDFKKHEVRISNVRSSLYPAEVIFWIDPKTSKTIVPYKFRRAPNSSPTVFTSSEAARTHGWRSRSMAPAEWTMFSWQSAAIRSRFGAIALHERPPAN